jgi:predicted TIM-barrel fold metal-dependent hydrolase
MNRLQALRLASLSIIAVVLVGCDGTVAAMPDGIHVEPVFDYHPDADCAARIKAIREDADPTKPLHERYRFLRVIDVHNHGANDPLGTIKLQDRYSVDRTILFGDISEPSAVRTDERAFRTYRQYPDKVYPYFAGIPLRDKKGIAAAVANLEKGFFGIGEIVAASTRSPVASRVAWKAQHPNDGILPEIYRLSAKYRVPILLHIDPTNGEPIEKLEQALAENPQAIIIFGHANAYNTPANIERLLGAHPNLYIDFMPGFTVYNPDSTNKLTDFVPVIEKYPDRFMVSTDSGYGIGGDKAMLAIYELLDLLTPETACKVAHENMDRIIESQPPTATQTAQIEALSRQAGERGVRRLNKRMANELIFELQDKLRE